MTDLSEGVGEGAALGSDGRAVYIPPIAWGRDGWGTRALGARREREKQIPFGNDRQRTSNGEGKDKGKDKGKREGEGKEKCGGLSTTLRFGRDDGFIGGVSERGWFGAILYNESVEERCLRLS
jgi:hypothetical protein